MPKRKPKREKDFAQLYEQALRTGKRRSSLWVYQLIALFIRTAGYRYFKFECRGAENLNTSGPVIIAPTHRSNLDVPLLAPSSKRHFRSLAKDSMFTKPAAAWFSATIGAIPVRRGAADRHSLRAVERLLADGEAVLVFPEGTRQSGLEVGAIFDGCAYLAARSQAPVIPVGIAGTEAAMPPKVKFPKRVKVVACVGKPMRASDFADSDSDSDETTRRMDMTDAQPSRPTTRKPRLSLQQRKEFSSELQRRLQELISEADRIANPAD